MVMSGTERARVLGALWLLGFVPACYDVNTVDPGIEVLPADDGRVYAADNALGIQGQWFADGDRYDSQSCIRFGMHGDLCSEVYFPPPNSEPTECPGKDLSYTTFPLGFPNQDGVMCTSGQVGKVVRCGANAVNCNNDLDFSNMWGAGIGLDFNLDVSSGTRDPTRRERWDATAHGIVGVAFDVQLIDDGGLGGPHLRVEFPLLLPDGSLLPAGKGAVALDPCADPVLPPADATESLPYPDTPTPTEEHPDGSPFWGAPPTWGDALKDVSPARPGHNVIHFKDIPAAPEARSEYAFDPTRLLGIQFHVPSFKADSDAGGHFGYGFCISNLTFLRE
jgi:hypothetical protein